MTSSSVRAIFFVALLLPFAAFADPLRLAAGIVEVQCHPKDESLGRESLRILEKALAEYDSVLPAGDTPIRVTIAASLGEFGRLAGEYGRSHVEGIARPEQGIIVVKAPYLVNEPIDYGSTLRHELLHVLLARNTNPAHVPRWFDEGLAMLVSRELGWDRPLRVGRMYLTRTLIPYRDLNFAFAPLGNETEFGNAYAQAASMTENLRQRLGDARFWELVHALKEEDFEAALLRIGGMTPGDLFDGWRRSLWKVALFGGIVSGFGLFQAMAVLTVILYLRLQVLNRRKMRQWAEEEAGQRRGRIIPWKSFERDMLRDRDSVIWDDDDAFPDDDEWDDEEDDEEP